MNALFDLNVILDSVLDRAPFVQDAKRVVSLVLNSAVYGYVTSLSIVTLNYIVAKNAGDDRARLSVQKCLATFGVLPVTRATIESAFALAGPDFEDNVQAIAARDANMDFIIARDRIGFGSSPVKAYTPAEFVKEMSGEV